MSDYFPGEITIGGRIPRRLLDELAERIASEGVSIDWQQALYAPAIREAIEAAAATGRTVRFTDDEAICGRFEDLEDWLTSRGIDFDRHNDARFEHDGENVYVRDRKCPMSVNSDQSGNDLVPVAEVREILASQSPPNEKLVRITRLAAAPPTLTPITLTDDERRKP